MRTPNSLTILALSLLMVILLLTNWGLQVNKEKRVFKEKNIELTMVVSALDELREELETEVDTLITSYNQVEKENEVLENLLSDPEAKLTSSEDDFQQAEIKSKPIRIAVNQGVKSLKERIQQLLKSKSNLEATIQKKTEANDILLDHAGINREVFNEIMEEPDSKIAFEQLQKEHAYAQEIKREAEINARVQRIAANLKPRIIERKILRATDFRLELEMRNKKVTSKAKRIKRILVSFDLNGVPNAQLGTQELYLVIKDNQQQLITEKTAPVKVRIKGRVQYINVVQSKMVKLGKKQRIKFAYVVDKKLQNGYYQVYLYAKSGLLGKTSFKVQ